jgi:hypothetical protein
LVGGGISLNFELDYELLNQKMAEFLDKHSDEINAIVGQCFRVQAPDAAVRMREIKGPITSNIPDEPFDNMFPNNGDKK